MEQKVLGDFMVFAADHLTKKIIYQDNDILTFVLNLKPGQKLPRHGHEGGTLTLQILQGAGTIAVNDQTNNMVTGQIYFLAGTDLLEVPEVTKDLSLLVNIAPNPSNPIYRQPR
jgi:redox-sensitive bicupin YhaK (pirin superfamily)